jgi:hypothetical protein
MSLSASVIIYNFHVVRVLLVPDETDAVLVVDPDAVLAGATSLERFEPVSGQRPEV